MDEGQQMVSLTKGIDRPRLGRLAGLVVAAMLAAGCTAPAAVSNTPTPGAAPSTAIPAVENQPIAGGPVLLRADMALRLITEAGGGSVKLALNPVDGMLYYLSPGSGIYKVDTGAAPKAEIVAGVGSLGGGNATGFTIGPDGTLYVVTNQAASGGNNRAAIRRGTPDADGGYAWDTLAITDPYPMSGTNFDHLYNGIVVSPDGLHLFVNAGSRTDHGEVEDNGGKFPDIREVALTSRILRLPIDAVDLALPNDEAALEALGVVYATGTRNAFDLAFAPNGDLFAIDNGPDADYPDELNWIQEGKHYGFPWRFGVFDNPQQFPTYDPDADKHLNSDFVAVQRGTYANDPDYPASPGGFTDPVANLGPAAAQYRADDGSARDAAAEAAPLNTFTPHRSPLGLVFVTDETLPAGLLPPAGGLSAFLTSWGSAGGTLTDRGQDLLHLSLTKDGDNYSALTTQIARDFKNPIDSVLIGNKLYILEFGGEGAIWEITFNR